MNLSSSLARASSRSTAVARTILAATTTLILALILTATAVADPATVIKEDSTFINNFVGPASYCVDGPAYNLTENYHFFGVTVDKNGQHGNFRYTLTVTASPLDPALPTATASGQGGGAFSFGGNGAEANQSRLTVKWLFSNGERRIENAKFHYTVTPDGTFRVFNIRCVRP